MFVILAIDPGYTQSAWVEFESGVPIAFGLEPNAIVLDRIRQTAAAELAIEVVKSYGMAVGEEVFVTCQWTGRFIQDWYDATAPDWRPVRRVPRREVKMYLCGRSSATDSNVRMALLDKYGPGKPLAQGTKAAPGPLYGVKKDIWAALGVAVTAAATCSP